MIRIVILREKIFHDGVLFSCHTALNNLVVLFRLFPGVFVHNISVYDTYDNIASKDVP
jgi:hypothetical protein